MDDIYKLSNEEMKSLYKEMGSTEANLINLLNTVNDLKRIIKEIQDDITQLKLNSAVTKVTLMMYGSLGGLAFSAGLYFVKIFLNKTGAE